MNDALPINDHVTIPAAELSWTAVRASGPGGQNVNKVASKVELRFDLAATRALDVATCQRLRVLAGARVAKDGSLRIVSQKTRDQQRNLEDARVRLAELVARALVKPVVRRATRPSRAAKARRLDEKRHQGARKSERRWKTED